MMGFWVLIFLFYAPSLVEQSQDPMQGWLPPAIDPRSLDCEPMTTEGARQRQPGRIGARSARNDYFERRAVVCRERLMAAGVLRAQDDAVLFELSDTAREIAAWVAQTGADERGRTWLVETYYPDSAVGQKVSFAVKNALLERDLVVSDRAPTLAAGDIEVIGGLPPQEAYPLACARYAATGSLRPDDALLAVVLRDPRETILHAGICTGGRWRWLR